jgi:hypothetical protein
MSPCMEGRRGRQDRRDGHRGQGRRGEDADRFAKALGNVAGRRLTYDELTGKP